jgi:NADH:ubiquinone oxidoreductase subunit D
MGHLMLIPELVVGAQTGDLPVILASLDIGVAEVDR